MGKTQLEFAIHDEARALVEHIKAVGEKPTGYPKGFRTAVLNVVWQLVASTRYDLESNEVERLIKVYEDVKEINLVYIFIEAFFPVLKSIPQFIKNRLFDHERFQAFRNESKRILSVSIRETFLCW